MKKKYIIGNWKSNKNIVDTGIWFKTFKELFSQKPNLNLQGTELVVCSPFVLLPLAKKLRDNYQLPIEIGAQDISPFANGAYTGEVCGSQIAEYAAYVIIGHSERRKNFGEDDKLLTEKVRRANEAGLISVYCVQDENTFIPDGVNIVAYEPVWAIGTGKTDSPENANHVADLIKQKWNGNAVIYGGSNTPENTQGFMTQKYIDGLLPGKASLDPNQFLEIIINAAAI